MIKEMPRGVMIDDTFIPAINVQIDGYPTVINGNLYMPYFEVMFENGDIWEVQKDRDKRIEVFVYKNFAKKQNSFADTLDIFEDWSDFLNYYKENK